MRDDSASEAIFANMQILTWNTEWAIAGSTRGKTLQALIRQRNPDVVCYTEVHRSMLPAGEVVFPASDYGYDDQGGMRKKLSDHVGVEAAIHVVAASSRLAHQVLFPIGG